MCHLLSITSLQITRPSHDWSHPQTASDAPIVSNSVYFARIDRISHGASPTRMTNAKNGPLRISVLDSHTAGEPTRCVLAGGPDLGAGPLSVQLDRLRREHDSMRRAVLCEPRGSNVIVGAWVLEPDSADYAAAVIFFNNAGYLGMCGHGMIGVAVTLAHLGRISPGVHAVQTPVGVVRVNLHSSNLATIDNVAAYRHMRSARVEVPGKGSVTGDVAWGGNWFFLTENHPCSLDLDHVDELTDFTWAIRKALSAAGVTGARGAEIDHIELFGPAQNQANHSRNFVLCPGKAYDRSPCGTGTSAKMACLVADGKLAEGAVWRQEGILGTVFEGRVRIEKGAVLPSITGAAYVTAESTLIFDAADPFQLGMGG
jgi:4-hydroxyproline epimerase